MKKIVSILLIFILCFGTLCVSCGAETTGTDEYVNVKDFGAKGDGISNDGPAIKAAFNYAVNNLPATVYFPEGEYGILYGGIYVEMPLGSGGLTVKGEGGNKSIIKYLENWVPVHSWVAIRIMPETTPACEEEYIHDITITGMGVYDTDPVGHAWTIENNGSKEETHGFDIQYCVRATVKDCVIDNVGDEAIDMVYCIDSIITDNSVNNSPGAGSAGGGISAGDGCKNIRITDNSVRGTISGKSNFGIAVEALIDPIDGVVISNNTITDIKGFGINIGAPRGTIKNIVIDSNNITDCSNGIRLMGTGSKRNITITDCVINNADIGITFEGGHSDNTLIDGFVIDGIETSAIRIKTPSMENTMISNGIITNCQQTAIYNAGINTKINNVLINGVGLAGNVKTAAISQYTLSGNCELNKVTIKNCMNSKAVLAVDTVIDTIIEQDEVKGYVSINGAKTIKGGKVNRIIQGLKDGGTVNGLEIYTETDLGTHAIYLNNISNCMIVNCRITIPSRNSIKEAGTADNNLIMNNIVNKSVSISGENSIEFLNLKIK